MSRGIKDGPGGLHIGKWGVGGSAAKQGWKTDNKPKASRKNPSHSAEERKLFNSFLILTFPLNVLGAEELMPE